MKKKQTYKVTFALETIAEIEVEAKDRTEARKKAWQEWDRNLSIDLNTGEASIKKIECKGAVSREPIEWQELQDLLGLVGFLVPRGVIESWAPARKKLAEDFAARSYLKASDNIIRVPAKPAFLLRYEK